MKDKAKSTFGIMLALYVILLVVIYMFVYKPYTEKAAALELSNNQLQVRVNELKQFYDKLPEYESKMAEMTKEINNKLEDFPIDVRPEDVVYLALRSWVDGAIVDYRNIGITEREVMANIEEATVQGAQMEGFTEGLVLSERQASYSNVTTYQQLKNMIISFDKCQEEMAINTVAYSAGGNGALKVLTGTVDVTFYMLDGTTKEYEPKEFKDYPAGLPNLFGTVELETIEELLEAEKGEDAE